LCPNSLKYVSMMASWIAASASTDLSSTTIRFSTNKSSLKITSELYFFVYERNRFLFLNADFTNREFMAQACFISGFQQAASK